jgi:glutamine synthetase
MAKPYGAEAGSSCHLHVSLWDRDGNAFAMDSGRSDVFRHFLGGWLAHLPESMVMYAPTVNSYKRFQEESWAPTRMVWSHDNRTAGFRIVGEDAGLRIECRIPGADCNPYLAFAAAIAAGLEGLEGRIEPPEEFIGNAYEATDAERVPTSLREATDAFVASDFVAQAFGEEVQAHYGHFFWTEQLAFDRAVTDWERSRYFERI